MDKSVFLEAQDEVRLEWQEISEIRVKGKKIPVTIFRPARVAYDVSIHKISHAKNLETQDRVSIETISTQINKAIGYNKNNNNGNNSSNNVIHTIGKNKSDIKGRVIFVEGEIGVGKTTLIEQVNVSNSKKCWFLWGKADCFHSITPQRYIVWRQLFLSFQARYSFLIPSHRQKLLSYLKLRLPKLFKFAFLLRYVYICIHDNADIY